MSGNVQASRRLQAPLNISTVRTALMNLGWQPHEWTNGMVVARKCQGEFDFSAFVGLQREADGTLVNVRILETSLEPAQAGCDWQAQLILSALS